MIDKFFGVLATVVMAGMTMAAQDSRPQVTQPQSPSPSPTTQTEDQSLTGCLIQGSGPAIFLLENAKVTAEAGSKQLDQASQAGQHPSSIKGTFNGVTYLVTVSAMSVDLKSQLNREVTITGTGDPDVSSAAVQAPSQNARMNEKDLPKFVARSVTKVGDSCSKVP